MMKYWSCRGLCGLLRSRHLTDQVFCILARIYIFEGTQYPGDLDLRPGSVPLELHDDMVYSLKKASHLHKMESPQAIMPSGAKS